MEFGNVKFIYSKLQDSQNFEALSF